MLYPGEVCAICSESININWICPDCHKIFCDDCVDFLTEEVQVCLHCNTSNVEINKRGRFVCDDCGNSDTQPVKKLVPACRNCGSTGVVQIEVQQESLLETYKSIVRNTRAFILPFEHFTERLNSFRTVLVQLRNDHPKCFHYPTIEADFLLILKLFDNSRNDLNERIFHYFQEIQRNMHYISEIKITHPGNLTYITEILKHFEREREKVAEFAKSVLNPLEERVVGLEAKLDFMTSVQTQFTAFLNQLALKTDEKIIFALKCKLSSGNSKTKQKDYSNKTGTILITNKRLSFYHERGLFNKQTVELISVEIKDLQEAGLKGHIKKKVSLEFLNSMWNFSISKQNREHLISWIVKAQTFDMDNMIDLENYHKLRRYKINIATLQEDLENTIYELIGYHGATAQSANSADNQVIHQKMYRTSNLPIQGKYHNPSQPSSRNTRASASYDPQRRRGRQSSSFMPSQYTSIPSDVNKTLKTPAGHYGYPHDQQTTFQPTRGMNARQGYPRNSQSIWNQQPTNQNNISHQMNAGRSFQQDHSQRNFNPTTTPPAASYNRMHGMGQATGNFGSFNAGQTPVPQSPVPSHFPSPLGGTLSFRQSYQGNKWEQQSGEEMQIRSEITRLQTEKYSIQNTIQMLEQKYDTGSMADPEFVKTYQEMQRRSYHISDRLTQLEKYLQDRFDLRNN